MGHFFIAKDCEHYDPFDPHTGQEQIYVQLVLSLALGLSAVFGFCFLRPRWKSLYAARKRLSLNTDGLPELPDTFFGWIPVLHSVTEDQILESAGLDAYVFLSFFKMSIKLFGTIFLITIAVLAPINSHFDWLPTFGDPNDHREPPNFDLRANYSLSNDFTVPLSINVDSAKDDAPDPTYLWTYLVFTYIFTCLSIKFMTSQTKSIIKVRQRYLGSRSTVANRTFKLSGIPLELRSDDKIKELLEKLNIGKVESVNIIQNCKELDKMIEKREDILRKLELAWTIYFRKKNSLNDISNCGNQTSLLEENGELSHRETDNLLGQAQSIIEPEDSRPKTRILSGFPWLQSKKIDMIDYYEAKIRRLDEKIIAARKKKYPTTPMAFVSMEDISACQIAVQALLDSSPTHLLAKTAPAPTDIVWQNTYLPRYNRMIRGWIISIFVVILTIFWVVPVAALAGLLDLCSIRRIFPKLAEVLTSNNILKVLVQTGLPTLIVSLLNIGVPFLYDFLSNQQGMISKGDVELSLISKNFFFTFFNVFLTFTIAGTATKFWSTLQDSLKDTTSLALKLAGSVQQVAVFFTNFIIFQGVGLIPFRLLEFGCVMLYPIMHMRSKTPRDFWELKQPPVFKYGFYLPSAILVYILCIVYSILPAGYMVLFFGVIYFINSYYTYKYQLLYAMDIYQHSYGGAWSMICYRLLLGLEVFQFIMAGIIALKNQVYAAGLVVPLIPFTIWYSYYFGRTYHPLLMFIALRKENNVDMNSFGGNVVENHPVDHFRERPGNIYEERKEKLSFVNPSLTAPLGKPWIKDNPPGNDQLNTTGIGDSEATNYERENSTGSLLSLGDTHIWRRNTTNNV